MKVLTGRLILRHIAVGLLLAALLLSAAIAGAAGEQQQATPIDVFCVKGSVINHAEKPSGGWTITAAMKDPATGSTLPNTSVDVETINEANNPNGPLGSFKFDKLGPGLWTFSLGARDGWSPVTTSTFDITLGYGRTDCVDIRFKMKEDVIVTVLKIDADHTPLAGFEITASPGAGNLFASAVKKTTDANGEAVFTLTPGLWEFSEKAPTGTNATPISPAEGKQSLNVTAPGPHSIRFKNRIISKNVGCIEVTKTDVPPDGTGQEPVGLPGWFINVLRADGATAKEGKTDATGRIVFNDLPFGPYTVHEQVPLNGWEAAAPVHYSVTLSSSDCVKIEFSNRQVAPAFCIVGRKVDANGNVGLPDWEIKAKPTVASNIVPDPVRTDGLGNFRIDFPQNDYRVPGAEYEVCETVPAGWLAHTATCQKVRLPAEPGACVALGFTFVNQQVGHSESKKGTPPVGCTANYTVKAGDQLYRIGSAHGKTPAQMRAVNPSIRNPNLIRPGQVICIP